jgi:hypothetical protein
MIATDEVRLLKKEGYYDDLITPWTNEDEPGDIVFNTVWNTKCCNFGFVLGKGEDFFRLVKERVHIQTDIKSKATKANAIGAARERAKRAQPLKVGGNLKRAAKVEKVEKGTPVIKQKKSKLEPASKAKDTILAVDASSASESAVIEI